MSKTIFRIKFFATYDKTYLKGDNEEIHIINKIYSSYSDAETDIPEQYKIHIHWYEDFLNVKLYFQIEKYFDVNE